jgi:hypothetical protein
MVREVNNWHPNQEKLESSEIGSFQSSKAGSTTPHQSIYKAFTQVFYYLLPSIRVVLSDVLGCKDVVEGHDGWMDGRTCRIVIGRIRVKWNYISRFVFTFYPSLIL